jgi:hypothetical protein
MTPQAEPSPYHDRRPVPRDLHYHVEDGRPVLDVVERWTAHNEELSDAE